MKTLLLHNSQEMPVIGLGTWRSDTSAVTQAIKSAILQYQYRHIDCASIYGNEKEIGQAFAEVFSTKKVKREEVFITSKLWNTDHHPDNVEKACVQTLKDLHLEYLDLYLIHWGIAFEHGGELEPMGEDGLVKTEPVPLQQTWRAMERLVQKGLVKGIGVANFTVPMIVDVLSYAKVKPVINQVEIHPYNSQVELVEYCRKQGIHVTAYSPLGSSGVSKDKPLFDQVIVNLAKAYNKTPAQIIIRWLIQRGVSTIPKTTQPQRIAENCAVFEFELSGESMTQINQLNKNRRFIDPVKWWGIPYFK